MWSFYRPWKKDHKLDLESRDKKDLKRGILYIETMIYSMVEEETLWAVYLTHGYLKNM